MATEASKARVTALFMRGGNGLVNDLLYERVPVQILSELGYAPFSASYPPHALTNDTAQVARELPSSVFMEAPFVLNTTWCFRMP